MHAFEEAMFSAALALPPQERRAFVQRACGADRDLCGRIEALLRGHELEAGAVDAVPGPAFREAAEALQAHVPPPELPSERIGRYRLLHKIAEGGCGIVYRAEQEGPVQRQVALKVLKAGVDTREMLARFGAERQALALMDHPSIARVFDAGETDSGRPYFVMELVRGIPITRYCDEHDLSPAARLRLFIQVCEAVQHAHLRGIIHRDLKPANILVTLHDGRPLPKIIDFGIAKTTGRNLTDLTLATACDQFIGTPAYMSPEQAELNGLDIDPRADVYSLGVLLYQLLTGQTPLQAATPVNLSRDEVRRMIRESDPVRPSRRITALTPADRSAVARQRGLDPARLAQLLAGDLDWIVMKAIERNRERRYTSPSALAADLARHLKHEPVFARPPGTVYRLGKLIRRRRVSVTATAVVGLALAGATVVSTWYAVRATQAEQAAASQRARAVEERGRVENLLAYMLGDLHTQLAQLGHLEVLESVSDWSMAYFASLDPNEIGDDTLAVHARALVQIGGFRMEQGRYSEAQAAYAASYARASALAARRGDDSDVMFARGEAELGHARLCWKRGDFGGAWEWFLRYRGTAAALAALVPANRDLQREPASMPHTGASAARGSL